MALVFNVLGHLQQSLIKMVGPLILVMVLLTAGCSQPQTLEPANVREASPVSTSRPSIEQVDTPSLIRELTPWLDTYEPQVHIRQPQAEQIFSDTTVTVVLQVQDLPIYKDETWNMGPHIELLIDNQPYGSVYNLEEPIILENLTPGTHTIRAFATRPWNESFKNVGAYAQVTFHILTKTDENSPGIAQPLLTYGAPVGRYGAEPVLLDFYLTNAPLHQVAQDNPAIVDWQVRCTLNGDSFTLKDWDAVYVRGLKPGKNWVQLTLVDDDGNPIQGIFNNTVRLIEYDPSLDDGLAKVIRGDLTLAEVGSIVDPTYEPPMAEVPEPAEKLQSEELDAAPELESTSPSDDILLNMAEPEASEVDVEVQPNPDSVIPNETKREEPEVKPEGKPETEFSDSSEQLLKRATAKQDTSGSGTEPDESPDTGLSDGTDSVETPSDETTQKTSTEKQFVNEPERVEETAPGTEESDVPAESASSSSETLEPSFNPETSDPESSNLVTSDEMTDESSIETVDEEAEVVLQETETSDGDAVVPKKRRYLQWLYDYRDRSMQTYGRDR